MVKISRAPKNFYTARQAAKALGMKEGIFHYYVRTGKIKKVVPPGGTEGYYPKIVIDKMVREKELFILEYASEPSNFERASEEDIKGIHDLSVSLFGTTEATSYEKMLEWYMSNPEVYYVVKQEGIVTGYLGMLYLTEETTNHVMSEALPEKPSPTSTEVLPFTPNQPVHGVFLGIGVRPGLGAKQHHYHARHLMTGGITVLENLARRNIPVRKLYATSRTNDGIKLCRKLGFKESSFPGDPLIRFELDLETTEEPIFKGYHEIIKANEPEKDG